MDDIENEIDPSQEYVDSFNAAYLISHHMPELADAISKSTGETDILKGFQDGRQTYTLEHFEKNLPEFLRDNPIDRENIHIDKTKKRDIEPDIER